MVVLIGIVLICFPWGRISPKKTFIKVFGGEWPNDIKVVYVAQQGFTDIDSFAIVKFTDNDAQFIAARCADLATGPTPRAQEYYSEKLSHWKKIPKKYKPDLTEDFYFTEIKEGVHSWEIYFPGERLLYLFKPGW